MKNFKPLFSILCVAVMALTFNSCKEDKSHAVSLLGTWATNETATTKTRQFISFDSATEGQLWEVTKETIGKKLAFKYVLEATTLTMTAKDATMTMVGKITTLNDRELSIAVSKPSAFTFNLFKQR